MNLKHDLYEVYIGRAGHGLEGYFGNPHTSVEPCTLCGGIWHKRDAAINAFKTYFQQRIAKDPEFRQRVLALRGKTLGCFCKPKRCHGDIIVEWIEAQRE